jgi:[NiFe] hydrogenase assembly HybE family chaperone
VNAAPAPESFERLDAAEIAGLGDSARLECGVCWHVYDPAKGDEAAKIEAGTPFRLLPASWRCPRCDAPRAKFIPLDAVGAATAAEQPSRVSRLVKAFQKRDEAMRDLPIHNGLLSVEAAGFRAFEGGEAGVLITPWAMNLILIPAAESPLRAQGEKRMVAFPSGSYEFIAGQLDGFGPFEMCSLFSPCFEFTDQAVARETALSAAEGLFTAPKPEPVKDVSVPSRRALLFGG